MKRTIVWSATTHLELSVLIDYLVRRGCQIITVIEKSLRPHMLGGMIYASIELSAVTDDDFNGNVERGKAHALALMAHEQNINYSFVKQWVGYTIADDNARWEYLEMVREVDERLNLERDI